MKITTLAMRQNEVDAQRADLDFDWYSERRSDIDKRYAYADTIFQNVKMTVETSNPIPALFETVKGEGGKKIKAKRHYGGKVYERSYGEYKRVSAFKLKTYTMTTNQKAMHIAVPIEDLRNGVITTSELVDEAARAILFYKVSTVWSTLKAALPTSLAGGEYVTSTATTITQSHIDTAIQNFGDRYKIAGMIGRHKYLWPITTFTGYDGGSGYPESVKQELHARGMTSMYKGVPIVTLQEFKDEMYGGVAADAGNIFIVSDEKGFNRYVEVAPLTSTNEVTRSTNMFHLYYEFEDGYAIWEQKFIHRLWDGTAANA